MAQTSNLARSTAQSTIQTVASAGMHALVVAEYAVLAKNDKPATPSDITTRMTTAEEWVTTELEGHVAHVVLNRPSARNAVDMAMARAIDEALDWAETMPDVRAIVLSAQGPVFCAGADLKALARGEGAAFIGGRGWAAITQRESPKPIIAAVEGAAFGGGCEIVLACDLAVTSTAGRFGLPEVTRGLLAAAGGASRLPHMIGLRAAMELLLVGEAIDAHEAARIGLVNRVVQAGDALRVAGELAAKIAANGPLAVRAAREIVAISSAEGAARAQELAQSRLEELLRTEDAAEGLRAFAERRPAFFNGR